MAVETRWTPERVDEFLKKLILDIHTQFVKHARTDQQFTAGMETIHNIDRDPRKPYVRF